MKTIMILIVTYSLHMKDIGPSHKEPLHHGKRNTESLPHYTSAIKEDVQGSINTKYQIHECTTLHTRERTGNFGSLN